MAHIARRFAEGADQNHAAGHDPELIVEVHGTLREVVCWDCDWRGPMQPTLDRVRLGEYALALAIALDEHPAITALACDTDGIDGSGDNAGVFVLPDTLRRARDMSVDAQQSQQNNDSYGFFAAIGQLLKTGPTRTNVNDFRAILIE